MTGETSEKVIMTWRIIIIEGRVQKSVRNKLEERDREIRMSTPCPFYTTEEG